MPIEFRCTHCQKLLRTPDDTAGKQAKCPECGAILTIPPPGSVPPAAAGGGAYGGGPGVPPPFAERPGPAASPFGASPGFALAGTLQPTRIDMGDIFGRTWEIFKEHWANCLAAWIVLAVISFLVIMVGMVAVRLAMGAVLGGLGVFLVYIGLGVFFAWLGVGNMIFCLKLARGQPATLADLFTGGPYLWTFILASLLFNVIVFAGMFLCVIPGVIFALMFSQHVFLIVDRKVGVLESLSMSNELTNGNKLTLFAIWLVAGIAGNLLTLLTCGLGALVLVPYMMLLAPVIYLAMSGQPTMDQMRYGPPSP